MANPEHLKILKQGAEIWNRWRAEYSDVKPDLAGIGLSEADLSGYRLTNAALANSTLIMAKLEASDLSGADLTHANFAYANLSDATLCDARLVGASFIQARLVAANLSRAELSVASFRAADMRSANFCEAILFETVFANTNLTDSKGLEKCIHLRPSTIDIRTLQQSGLLPESFLRGCGLPDELIRFLPSLLHHPIQFYSCFISYSHEDKAFARRLHDRLQGQGIRCWLDEHQLLPGDDLHEGIDRGIRLWDKVLLCASQASLTSWWVDGEINRAFQKEAQIMKERGKKVLALIPLNLDGFIFSANYQSGKKAEITSRVAANFVGWEKDHALFDRELEKVIRALRTGEGGREKPPPARL
jgi:hypothetical protein